MLIHECPGYLRVNYVEGKDYISFDWEDFSVPLEDLKEAHAEALDEAVSRSCFRYVAQCSRARDSLFPEVIVWWRQDWVPKLIASGVRRIVTVVPSSTLASLSNRDWQRDLVAELEIINVPSLAAAEAALDLGLSARG